MFGAWGLTGVPKQRKTEKAGLSLWRESCLMLGAKGFFWELISEGWCFLENCYTDELTCAMRFLNVEIMFKQSTFLPHEFKYFKLYCKMGWFQQHQRWLKCRLKPSFGRWGIPQRTAMDDERVAFGCLGRWFQLLEYLCLMVKMKETIHLGHFGYPTSIKLPQAV